jgi:hypothetical protein
MPPALARIGEALGTADLGSIAEALGFPYGTVRNWHQRGSVSLPGLQAASKRTGRTIEYLLEGDQHDAKKFASSGLEINQMRGGDAFGQVPKVTENMRNADSSPPPSLGHTETPRAVYATNAVKSGQSLGGPGTVNVELLGKVLQIVGDELSKRGLHLVSDKHAELVALIYEHLIDQPAEAGEVVKTARRYLRLVA